MSDTLGDEIAGVETKVVGKSGQISLGKCYAGKTFPPRAVQGRASGADGGGVGARDSTLDTRGATPFPHRTGTSLGGGNAASRDQYQYLAEAPIEGRGA